MTNFVGEYSTEQWKSGCLSVYLSRIVSYRYMKLTTKRNLLRAMYIAAIILGVYQIVWKLSLISGFILIVYGIVMLLTSRKQKPEHDQNN